MVETRENCTASRCHPELCHVPDRVVLAESYEVPRECPLLIPRESALQVVHRLRRAHRVVLTRAAAARVGESVEGGRDTRLAELVGSGLLVLLDSPAPRPRFGATKLPRGEPVEPPPPPPSEVKTWIGIKVVRDATGEAVPGVKFRLRLPNGRDVTGTTRADGSFEIHDIDAGTCDILEMIDDEGLEVVRVE